jgi:hypothetical protein
MPTNPLNVPDNAVAICEPVTLDLAASEKGTVTFTPEQSGTAVRVPTVAVSKVPDTSYTIEFDGDSPAYGPAGIPPTDIDDLATVWIVPQEFQDECIVTVKNLGSNQRTYHILLIGWEV